MNVDGTNIYTKAHLNNATDQLGRIFIGREEFKVQRNGHNAMLEEDAVHIGCEADLAAHLLDVQSSQISLKGLLCTDEKLCNGEKDKLMRQCSQNR